MSRSLAALRELKGHYKTKIEEKYYEPESKLSNERTQLCKKLCEDLMKKIEEHTLKEFPVKKILKCERDHSEYNLSEKSVSIGVRVNLNTPEITAIDSEIKKITDQRQNDKKRLDQWEVEALKAYAEGVGLPSFEVIKKE